MPPLCDQASFSTTLLILPVYLQIIVYHLKINLYRNLQFRLNQITQTVSEYGQEMPQSHCRPLQSTMRKRQNTNTAATQFKNPSSEQIEQEYC